MLPKVVIWGASGHALVVADALRLRGEYEVAGFLDDYNPDRRGQSFNGLPVFGGRNEIGNLRRQGVRHLIFGFGDCAARHRLAPFVKENGFEFATAIHPRATIAADASIGAGTVVMAGAVVNACAVIGCHGIINTCASVDHECAIGDSVHVGPGARLGGRVTVGGTAWVGIGATVLDRIRIGSGSIVGAGSVVTRDVPPNVVAYGVPARVVRAVKPEPQAVQD